MMSLVHDERRSAARPAGCADSGLRAIRLCTMGVQDGIVKMQFCNLTDLDSMGPESRNFTVGCIYWAGRLYYIAMLKGDGKWKIS